MYPVSHYDRIHGRRTTTLKLSRPSWPTCHHAVFASRLCTEIVNVEPDGLPGIQVHVIHSHHDGTFNLFAPCSSSLDRTEYVLIFHTYLMRLEPDSAHNYKVTAWFGYPRSTPARTSGASIQVHRSTTLSGESSSDGVRKGMNTFTAQNSTSHPCSLL